MTSDGVLLEVQASQAELLAALRGINQLLNRQRRPPTAYVRQLHIMVVQHRRNGFCASCEHRRVTNESGQFTGEIDHWFSPDKNNSDETWPVCRECNLRLRNSGFKSSKTAAFTAYQQSVRVMLLEREGQQSIDFSESAAL
jgi:hypothetical protein